MAARPGSELPGVDLHDDDCHHDVVLSALDRLLLRCQRLRGSPGPLSAGYDLRDGRNGVRLHRHHDPCADPSLSGLTSNFCQWGTCPFGMTCGGVPRDGACGFDCACH